MFRKSQCVFEIDAQISNRVLDLGVAQQDLYGAEIAGCLVDERSLGAPERMRAILLLAKTDGGHPLIDQPGILPSAQNRSDQLDWETRNPLPSPSPFEPP